MRSGLVWVLIFLSMAYMLASAILEPIDGWPEAPVHDSSFQEPQFK